MKWPLLGDCRQSVKELLIEQWTKLILARTGNVFETCLITSGGFALFPNTGPQYLLSLLVGLLDGGEHFVSLGLLPLNPACLFHSIA